MINVLRKQHERWVCQDNNLDKSKGWAENLINSFVNHRVKIPFEAIYFGHLCHAFGIISCGPFHGFLNKQDSREKRKWNNEELGLKSVNLELISFFQFIRSWCQPSPKSSRCLFFLVDIFSSVLSLICI